MCKNNTSITLLENTSTNNEKKAGVCNLENLQTYLNDESSLMTLHCSVLVKKTPCPTSTV